MDVGEVRATAQDRRSGSKIAKDRGQVLHSQMSFDDGAGTYRPYDDTRVEGAAIRASAGATNEWDLTFKDGRRWHFKPFPGIAGKIRGSPPTFVTEMIDAAGNVLSISRQPNGRINKDRGQVLQSSKSHKLAAKGKGIRRT